MAKNRQRGKLDMPSMTPDNFTELELWIDMIREQWVDATHAAKEAHKVLANQQSRNQLAHWRSCIAGLDLLLSQLTHEKVRHQRKARLNESDTSGATGR